MLRILCALLLSLPVYHALHDANAAVEVVLCLAGLQIMAGLDRD